MTLPDNLHPECKELGMCVLRTYKGYFTCGCSGSCSLADSAARLAANIKNEAFRPTENDPFGPGKVWTARQFDSSEKP